MNLLINLFSQSEATSNVPRNDPERLSRKLECQTNARKQAIAGLLKQGRKMMKRSDKLHPTVEVGDNVIVQIPSLDKAKSDLPNVIGVTMDVSDNGLHRIGTKSGILDQMYTRYVPQIF